MGVPAIKRLANDAPSLPLRWSSMSVRIYLAHATLAEARRPEKSLENCLNEGVHLKTLWGLLWVDCFKKMGNCG